MQNPLEEDHPSNTSILNLETKWLVLIAIGIGTFMSALDGSVVNTLLPVIKDYFQSDVATIEWVVTIYLLVVSGLLLSFGRLGDLRGNKTVYLWGFAIFVLGSALSGLSPSPLFLITSRAFQAIGATMLFANSPAILTKTFPSSQRGQALGLQGSMTYLGLTTGPFLGGWLADTFSWHAVFFINVPIGILAVWLSWRVIPKDANNAHHEGLIIGSIILLGVFVWIERRAPAPMLDLNLFQSRLFNSSTLSPILNYICVYSVLFLMPFYLIQGRNLSAAQAGLILTAQPVVMALMAPLAGTLSDRFGSQMPTTLGMLVLAGGLFLLSRLTPASPFTHVILGLAVSGLGTGLFVAPNNSALMGAAPRNRQGIASGVLALSRNVGMVLGIGLAGAIFTTFLSRGDPNRPNVLVPAISAGLLFACGVALSSAIISYARGDDRPKAKKTPE
jgi:MFS family permease